MTWQWDPEELAAIEDEAEPRATTSIAAAMAIAFDSIGHAFANGGRNRDPRIRNLPYEDYLRTPHWQHFRRRLLAQAGYCCQQCGAEDVRLDVHHRSYDRLGRELDDDVIVLCFQCHASEHGR